MPTSRSKELQAVRRRPEVVSWLHPLAMTLDKPTHYSYSLELSKSRSAKSRSRGCRLAELCVLEQIEHDQPSEDSTPNANRCVIARIRSRPLVSQPQR